MEIIPGNSISYDLHAPDTTFIADCWLTDIRLWNGMEEWVANNSMHSIRNRCHLAGIQTLLQSGINKNAWIHPLLAGNQRMRRQSVSQCIVAACWWIISDGLIIKLTANKNAYHDRPAASFGFLFCGMAHTAGHSGRQDGWVNGGCLVGGWASVVISRDTWAAADKKRNTVHDMW